MISAEIRRYIERAATAVLASTDNGGQPHLVLGNICSEDEGDQLVFENWLCKKTMDNVRENPQVSVAIIAPEERIGYQFLGSVVNTVDVAMVGGYQPEEKPSGDLQVLTRLIVRVEKVVAFCEGLHVDR